MTKVPFGDFRGNVPRYHTDSLVSTRTLIWGKASH
jgi:hypothetical protein